MSFIGLGMGLHIGLSLFLCRALLILVAENTLVMITLHGYTFTSIGHVMLIPLLFIGLTIIFGSVLDFLRANHILKLYPFLPALEGGRFFIFIVIMILSTEAGRSYTLLSPPTWLGNPSAPLVITQAVPCVIALSLAVLLGVGMIGL